MEYVHFQVTILKVFDQNISAIFKHQAFRMKIRHLTNKIATPSSGGLTSSMVYILKLQLKKLSLLVCKGASCNCKLHYYFLKKILIACKIC